VPSVAAASSATSRSSVTRAPITTTKGTPPPLASIYLMIITMICVLMDMPAAPLMRLIGMETRWPRAEEAPTKTNPTASSSAKDLVLSTLPSPMGPLGATLAPPAVLEVGTTANTAAEGPLSSFLPEAPEKTSLFPVGPHHLHRRLQAEIVLVLPFLRVTDRPRCLTLLTSGAQRKTTALSIIVAAPSLPKAV
jgi:hypothetical protein